jgi:tetratricopeptide (TPR) repeat protein
VLCDPAFAFGGQFKELVMKSPQLSELFTDYLRRSIAEPQLHQALPESEVELHQAASLALVEPRQALQDATTAATWLLDKVSAAAFRSLQMPPGWALLVRNQEALCAIPFCLGYYPQMLRDVGPLLAGNARAALLAAPNQSAAMTDVVAWAEAKLRAGRWAESLFAVAVLRSWGQHDAARKFFGAVAQFVPASWDVLVQNEKAALSWSAGDRQGAANLWAEVASQKTGASRAASTPVLFNRGLAALVAEQFEEARKFLSQAVESLPDGSAWHHLGRVYVSLASVS